MSSARAIVIGGGVTGLATASLLARDGYRVSLLEARDELGGRAGVWHADGFRFDLGPSWYLMPDVYDHFFRLLGTTAAEQYGLTRLDPGYRVFFENRSTPVDIGADPAANIDTFERIEPGAGTALRRYLDSAADTYDIAMRSFLYNTFSSVRPFITKPVIARAGRLIRLLREPLDDFIGDHVSDPRLRQILGYPAVFLGSAPHITPSLYHLMSHFDLDDGVYYPAGGFAGLVDRLGELARGAGVDLRTGHEVTAIETDTRHGRTAVTGVRVREPNGTERVRRADVVVSTADLHHTEHALLPPELRSFSDRWWRSRNPGPSAVLVMLGIRGALPELAHHNLLFTEDWDTNFRSIFSVPTAVPDPASLYVSRASATDGDVAPDGCENLFVLVPVPADPTLGRSGDAGVEAVADAAIAQVAAWANIPDLADRVVVRRTRGPADFDGEFHAWHGGALGPAHTLRQSAFLRGRNYSRTVRGLLYAGATTIPGIGVPMCLISAELVLKRLWGRVDSGPLTEH